MRSSSPASNASSVSSMGWSEGSDDEVDWALEQAEPRQAAPEIQRVNTSDAALAQALQMQETHDRDLAARWQREEDDAYRSSGRAHGSMARLAQRLGRDKVPALLINTATKALFVNASFDMQTGQSVDGAIEPQQGSRAQHIQDYALCRVVDAWAQQTD